MLRLYTFQEQTQNEICKQPRLVWVQPNINKYEIDAIDTLDFFVLVIKYHHSKQHTNTCSSHRGCVCTSKMVVWLFSRCSLSHLLLHISVHVTFECICSVISTVYKLKQMTLHANDGNNNPFSSSTNRFWQLSIQFTFHSCHLNCVTFSPNYVAIIIVFSDRLILKLCHKFIIFTYSKWNSGKNQSKK